MEELDAKEAIEGLFEITDKNRKVVPFVFNPIQTKYYNNRTSRDIILKARQQGFSTLILAMWLWECVSEDNTNAVVVAQDKETTQFLLERVRLYIRRMEQKPFMEYESKQQLYFPKRNSRFFIGTAGSDSFGRSHTITHFHGTEIAQWPNTMELLSSIMPAIPESGKVVLETTAHGFGNDFHKMWQQAVEGKSNFKPHFFPWHGNPEYTLPGAKFSQWPRIDGKTEPTEEELSWMKEGMTEEQLCWRRKTLREPQYVDNPDIFRQEYPHTSHEAFLATGESYFPNSKVYEMLSAAKDPKRLGEINQINHFHDMEVGNLKLWKLPHELKEPVVIGADSSEGLSGGDPAAAVILGARSMEHVGTWHGWVSPEEFARILFHIGHFYRQALIGVESNGSGIVTNLKLKEMNYPKLYRRQQFDYKIRKTTGQIGWNTNTKTREIMLQELRTSIQDGSLLTFDKELLTELLSFKKKGKRYEAERGSHDDLIFAMGIALQMRAVTPLPAAHASLEPQYVPLNAISGYVFFFALLGSGLLTTIL